MKSLLIIAAGALGIGLGIMLYRRKFAQQQLQPEPHFIPKKHHLTNAFSKAKKHAVK